MIKHLYTFAIHFYKLTIGFLSLFNKKAKLKINGIQESKSRIVKFGNNSLGDRVFIHCSSQGEHEQAKPLIRWILANTEFQILITFFSPSGFENADINDSTRITKAYLPFDKPKEISKFIGDLNPIIAIIIKNEWWWNLIHTLRKLNVPTYLVSATFRKNHYFIKFKLQFFSKGLKSFSKVFVVDQQSQKIISEIVKSNIYIAGDTRVDQVNYLRRQNLSNKNLIDFKNNEAKKVIVYGSIWLSDIESIKELLRLYPDAIHIIYPHELNSTNIAFISKKIPESKVVTHTKDIIGGANIITAMGELKYAYKLASLAYIGGAFGAGVHNVLEAAGYNIPTLFGPNYKKSNEAKHLVLEKCAFTFYESRELEKIIDEINKEKNRKEIESKLKAYFSPELSPTELICKEIFLKNDLHV